MWKCLPWTGDYGLYLVKHPVHCCRSTRNNIAAVLGELNGKGFSSADLLLYHRLHSGVYFCTFVLYLVLSTSVHFLYCILHFAAFWLVFVLCLGFYSALQFASLCPGRADQLLTPPSPPSPFTVFSTTHRFSPNILFIFSFHGSHPNSWYTPVCVLSVCIIFLSWFEWMIRMDKGQIFRYFVALSATFFMKIFLSHLFQLPSHILRRPGGSWFLTPSYRWLSLQPNNTPCIAMRNQPLPVTPPPLYIHFTLHWDCKVMFWLAFIINQCNSVLSCARRMNSILVDSNTGSQGETT